MRRLTIGHSPDADDAFMFYALTAGLVPLNGPEPAEITAVHDDIQSLNERAQSAELDISQISAAAYPAVAHRYRITACGSSMGENYGPVVVAPQPQAPADLAGARIAVPGPHTTAFSLARMYLPDSSPSRSPSTRPSRPSTTVAPRPPSSSTKASSPTPPPASRKSSTLAKPGSPTPAFRCPSASTSSAATSATHWCHAIATALAASIDHARANPALALEHARAIGADLDEDITTRFTNMYVTNLTRNMGPQGHAALTTLYQRTPTPHPIPLDIVPAP